MVWGGIRIFAVENVSDMAVQIDQPRRPMNVVLKTFARQAVQTMEEGFRVQKIWPYEIYPGYKRVNEYRKEHGGWYATGRGEKSFTYEVTSGEGQETIRIEFNDYLRFVDMGTAGGQKVEDVQRERKARYNKRYVAFWDASHGESHRPSIMREARHLEARMQNYLEDFYGREVNTVVYKTFSGLKKLELGL